MAETDWKARYMKLLAKVHDYEAIIKERDREIVALKTIIAKTLKKPTGALASWQASESPKVKSGRKNLFSRDEEESLAPIPTKSSSLYSKKAEQRARQVKIKLEPGPVNEAFAAEETLFAPTSPEPAKAAQLRRVAPTEPGRFLRAVLDGEAEAERIETLLLQLKTSKDEQRASAMQQLAVTHRHITHAMMYRMAPASLPWEKRLFMRYGMLDEVLTPDHHELWKALYEDDSEPGDSGVYFLDEWFEAVASGEISISTPDETGSSSQAPDLEATGQQALAYELTTASAMQSKCVGQNGVRQSVLMQEFYTPGPDNPVINREWIARVLMAIETVDHTLWHRSSPSGDFTVKPLFLVMPGYGEAGICWEPYAPGRIRSTGPRICMCAFQPSSSLRALLKGLGDYRWEHAKANARQRWTSEGLTGEWRSLFTKEELKEDIKMAFLEAYHLWITQESKGVPALQPRFRDFLWRHAPFSEEVKEGLAENETFSDLLAEQNG